jgi:hypothetical protein
MYKIPNSTDVIVHFLGKRQAFTNEPRNSLNVELTFFHVNSTTAKNRSARGARGTIFVHFGCTKRGQNEQIKPTSN